MSNLWIITRKEFTGKIFGKWFRTVYEIHVESGSIRETNYVRNIWGIIDKLNRLGLSVEDIKTVLKNAKL